MLLPECAGLRTGDERSQDALFFKKNLKRPVATHCWPCRRGWDALDFKKEMPDLASGSSSVTPCLLAAGPAAAQSCPAAPSASFWICYVQFAHLPLCADNADTSTGIGSVSSLVLIYIIRHVGDLLGPFPH